MVLAQAINLIQSDNSLRLKKYNIFILWLNQQKTPTNQGKGSSPSFLKKISQAGLIHRTALSQIKIE